MTESSSLHLPSLTPAERVNLGLRGPAPFYVRGEEAIQLSAICSAANVLVVMAGRFLSLDGHIQSFEFRLPPTADRVITHSSHPLGEGWILNFGVYAATGTPAHGQCWVRVRVMRGNAASAIALGTLAAGCLTSEQSIAFPGSPIRGTMDGPGFIRSITGSNPAAGAQISETVPTGARWRLLALRASLVTDATVANRQFQLQFDDGTNVFADAPSQHTQTASQTNLWTWNRGIGWVPTALLSTPLQNLAELPLMAGYRIRTVASNFQAGDNWASPQLLVEEFLEGAS